MDDDVLAAGYNLRPHGPGGQWQPQAPARGKAHLGANPAQAK